MIVAAFVPSPIKDGLQQWGEGGDWTLVKGSTQWCEQVGILFDVLTVHVFFFSVEEEE